MIVSTRHRSSASFRFLGSPSRSRGVRLSLRLPPYLLPLLLLLAQACATPTAPPPDAGDGPLRLRTAAGAVPDSVVEAFERHSGLEVDVETSDTSEAVSASLRAGEPADLALVAGESIPGLIAEDLLAVLDPAALPHFEQVTPSFRDLALDPGNRHSVPYDYGTTGFILRLDRLERIPQRWEGLWDLRLVAEGDDAGTSGGESRKGDGRARIAAYDRPRDLLGGALVAAGHASNDESPEALEDALDRLLELDPPPLIAPEGTPPEELLREEGVVLLIGRAEDFRAARDAGLDVIYVNAGDGGLLWSRHLVVPAEVEPPRRAQAQRLIDYLLRPEIGARIARERKVAVATDAAMARLHPDLRWDKVSYPRPATLRRSALQAPLSASGDVLLQAHWQQLLAALEDRAR